MLLHFFALAVCAMHAGRTLCKPAVSARTIQTMLFFLLQLDVRQLAAIAKSNCGRKRMRLDETLHHHQQQLQQQAGAVAAAVAGSGDQQQQLLQPKLEVQGAVQPKPEGAAAASTVNGMEVDGSIKQEQQEKQQQEGQEQEQQQQQEKQEQQTQGEQAVRS